MEVEVDNITTIDWWWGETEYGVPDKRRLKRQRETYEATERGEEDKFV